MKGAVATSPDGLKGAAASEVDGDINAPDVQPFSASITEALDLPLIRLEAGSTLMSIGDADQDMCFVESGTLTA